MLNFPKSTQFHKRIPKRKFYENIAITPALKRIFVEQIESIYWTHKIAATTTNFEQGTSVTEIEVFEINVKQDSLDAQVFKQIDKAIPYHIVYLLKFEDQVQVWIAYKVRNGNEGSLRTVQYFHTEWLTSQEIPLMLQGQTLDAVYENFVRQIAGEQLDVTGSLDEDIARGNERQKREKEIARLEKLAHVEKQPKKKFELVQKINELKGIQS